MSKNLRIAVVQIYAHPAYVTNTTLLLKEPTGEELGLGVLYSSPNIKAIRNNILDHYLKNLKSKVEYILEKCIEKNVNLIVFPEYAIPAEILECIREVSISHRICIIAGSHMISQNNAKIYSKIGLNEVLEQNPNNIKIDTQYIRQAMCPVFLPDGSTYLYFKNNRSQWESNLIVSQKEWSWIEVGLKDLSFNLGVKICIDALKDSFFRPLNDLPSMLVITSCTPKTEYFEQSANFVLRQEIPVLYLNEASKGKTKVYGWIHRDNRNIFLDSNGTVELPSKEEILLVADVALESQFGKNSTVNEHEPLKICSLAPLIYSAEKQVAATVEDLDSYKDLGDDLKFYEELSKSHEIPSVYSYKLTHLCELINEGVVRDEDKTFLTEFITMPYDVEPLFSLEYSFLKKLQKGVSTLIGSHSTEKIIKVLNDIQTKIDKIKCTNTILEEESILSGTIDSSSISYEKPYFGRDKEIALFRQFSNNQVNMLCFIFGMRGIGKSSFLSEALNRVLPSNWTRMNINVTEGTGFNRFILTLCHYLKVHINEESLEKLNDYLLNSILDKVVKKFESLPTACILIDDWHYTMTRNGYRDWKFEYFIEYISSYRSHSKNKFIITSQFKFRFPGGTNRIILTSLNEESIRAIIDWNLKLNNQNQSESNIPQELIQRLHGNPLAAIILTQLLESFTSEALLENTSVQKRFQDRLIPLFLEKIDLSKEEKELVEYLSVYNVPIEFEAIENFSQDSVGLIENLTDCFLLDFDSETGYYQMHPLIRDYFYKEIPIQNRIDYHKLAEKYYEKRNAFPNSSPIYKAEHIAHLAHSLQLDKLKEMTTLYNDELRPVAYKLFKNRLYNEALQYYKLLNKIYNNDLDIIFHIGLCFGNLKKWADAERFIDKALEIEPKAWWILVGYANILIKNRDLSAAEKNLNHALEIMNDNPTIKSRQFSSVYQSLALLREKYNDLAQAEFYYNKAIDLDSDSAFAHYAYAKFLWWKLEKGDSALEHLEKIKILDSSFMNGHYKKLKDCILQNISEDISDGEEDEDYKYEYIDEDEY